MFSLSSPIALSINFFSWIGLIVYITTMVSAEFHQGTIRASVVYGINRTKLFLSKLLVINVHFFILYYIVETALGLSLRAFIRFILQRKQSMRTVMNWMRIL